MAALRWNLKWGAQIKFWLKSLEEGKEAPSQYYEQPELADHEYFYWNAFHDLTTERAVGMGVGPIPYSAVRRYAVEFDIVGRDEFDYFLGIIHAMDLEYVSHANKDKSKEADLIPISDVESQHRMFARLAARAKRD